MRQTVRQESVERDSGMPDVLFQWLPSHVSDALSGIRGRWEELYLRVGRACSVTVEGQNRRVGVMLRPEEMETLVMRLCDGSLYAHRESLVEGYIALPGGIRVGVCGRAARDGTQGLLAIRTVDTLCIRFSHALRNVGRAVDEIVRRAFPLGTLIYAPPGQGKTTLLRALAARFSGGECPLRVTLVDTRCELDDGGFALDSCLSVLSGYPKGKGIEIAARTLNAQLIICDEIGGEEANAVIAAANCGVPVLATAHAASPEGLLCRPGMRALHDAAVFDTYIGIRRGVGVGDFAYTVTQRTEVIGAVCS